MLKDVTRDRQTRPSAFWEWIDRIEGVAARHEKNSESEKPVGFLDGLIELGAWPALRAKYKLWAGAYRELLKDPDVVAAMNAPWRPIGAE